MCTRNDIGGGYTNQKHNEMPFRALANMLFYFLSFSIDFMHFEKILNFSPLLDRLLVTSLLITRYFVTLFSNLFSVLFCFTRVRFTLAYLKKINFVWLRQGLWGFFTDKNRTSINQCLVK